MHDLIPHIQRFEYSGVSAAYSGEELDASPSVDASSETVSQADTSTPLEGSTTNDGGSDVASNDSGHLAIYTFDGVNCDPWVAGANTTMETVPVGPASKACRICSNAVGGPRISVYVDGVGKATYRATSRLMDESYAGTVQLELRFQGDGGTTIGPNATVQPNKNAWKDLVVSGPTAFAPTLVVVVLSAYSGPGCVLVDDATIAIVP